MRRIFTVIVLAFTCAIAHAQKGKTIDQRATLQTKALYENLGKLSRHYTLFGHQHATEYGHGWAGDENRSDVQSVTGSHPAVIGLDIMNITTGSKQNIAIEKER